MVAEGAGRAHEWAYDGGEILADGIVHGLGLVLAVAGSIALLGFLVAPGGALSHSIYCATLLITLTASAAYNLWPVSPTKWALRRLDHAMIFGLIAGTYTPFLARIGSLETSLLLAAIWGAAVTGMVVKLINVGRRERLATVLYIALGWSGVVTIRTISGSMPAASLVLLLIGGLLYSGGAVFHHWRSLRFQNAIWHSFVLGGAAAHFTAVLLALRAA